MAGTNGGEPDLPASTPGPSRRRLVVPLTGALALGLVLAAAGASAAFYAVQDLPVWAPDPDGPPHPRVVPDLVSGTPAIDSPALAPIKRSDLGIDSYDFERRQGPGTVSGRVASRDGRPLPGMPVSLVPREIDADRRLFGLLRALKRPDPVSTTTDAQGRYAFTDLPHGEYGVHIRRQAFGWKGEELELGPGADVAVFDPDIPVHGAVEGLILDPAGRPLPGMGVITLGTLGANGTNLTWGTRWPEAESVTGANGRFRVRGLPPGRSVIAAVGCHQAGLGSEVSVRANETTTGVTLVYPGDDPQFQGRVPGTVRMLVRSTPSGPAVTRVPSTSTGSGRLRPGDVIEGVEGRPTLFMQWADFVRTLGGEPGTTVRLSVRRGGAEVALSLPRQPVGPSRDWLQ